jgi:hypothetical protein
MSARYELRPRGVFDTQEGVHITPDASNPRWRAYQEWLAAGGEPVPPAPEPLDRRRRRMADRVNDRRERVLARGVPYMGHEFAADTRSALHLNNAVTLLAAGLQLPDGFAWRATDNTLVPMTPQELRGLLLEIFRFADRVHRRAWAIKAQIEASDAPETIDIERDWPGEPPPSNEMPPTP